MLNAPKLKVIADDTLALVLISTTTSRRLSGERNAEVRTLLERSHAALPVGGMLIVHDAFLNAAKDGPLHVAEYSVMLMHATQGRCYSSREIGSWAEACGFHSISYVDTAAARGVLTALK